MAQLQLPLPRPALSSTRTSLGLAGTTQNNLLLLIPNFLESPGECKTLCDRGSALEVPLEHHSARLLPSPFPAHGQFIQHLPTCVSDLHGSVRIHPRKVRLGRHNEYAKYVAGFRCFSLLSIVCLGTGMILIAGKLMAALSLISLESVCTAGLVLIIYTLVTRLKSETVVKVRSLQVLSSLSDSLLLGHASTRCGQDLKC